MMREQGFASAVGCPTHSLFSNEWEPWKFEVWLRYVRSRSTRPTHPKGRDEWGTRRRLPQLCFGWKAGAASYVVADRKGEIGSAPPEWTIHSLGTTC